MKPQIIDILIKAFEIIVKSIAYTVGVALGIILFTNISNLWHR